MIINLNSSGDIRSPRSSKRVLWALAIVLTVGLFLVLVKLGFWQLSRGEEKLLLEQKLQDREQMTPMVIEQLVGIDSKFNLTGFPLQVDALPEAMPLIYIDNVTYQGRVGYTVLQAMAVHLQGKKQVLLVELGFAIAPSTRDHLPKVDSIENAGNLVGRVYQRSINPLSSDVMSEQMVEGIRIQNLNLKQLAKSLNLPLFDFVLQPYTSPNSHLPKIWSPYPMTSQKHFGYAFQWFGMAFVYALLVVLFVMRKRKVKE
ncbi:SURF1-like protein [Vibrio inusitatus NBRC 102082]|uniref:SURF1-like protein n=2 Tax=Vibrio inusitatus TaxID=413402 RepID=A0A4Y3HZN2_9VIBR|nr:SURF1-like protein [Vibrio inusitatus NBRC 102082]